MSNAAQFESNHSHLVQQRIGSPTDADRGFGGGSQTTLPAVLVPRSACCCYSFMNVPSGPYVLWQKWNKHQGALAPGLKMCWPSWNRISHIVSAGTFTYNAPTANCPSADNVFVNISLSLDFRIGPDAQAAYDFVYHIGAHRFDEYLSQKIEEAVRGLVYGVTHDKVNDLREEFATGMLQNLNSTMAVFGVQILSVKITDVRLPAELQSRMERTTAFKTKIEEAEKSHETRKYIMRDEAEQQLEAIRKTNSRRIQEIEAEIARFTIEREEMIGAAKSRAEIALTEMRGRTEVTIASARGEEKVAKAQGQKAAEELQRTTEIACRRKRIEAEQAANTMIRNAEAKLDEARNLAQGLIARAEAEQKGAEKLAERRRIELELKRLEVMRQLAGSGRRVIMGEKANIMLNDLVPRLETPRA